MIILLCAHTLSDLCYRTEVERLLQVGDVIVHAAEDYLEEVKIQFAAMDVKLPPVWEPGFLLLREDVIDHSWLLESDSKRAEGTRQPASRTILLATIYWRSRLRTLAGA